MRWLWIILTIVVGVPLVFAIVGSFLPRDHVAGMTVSLKSSPDRVWALISDPEGTAAWRSDVKKVEMLPAVEGRTRFVEHSSNGAIPFEILLQEPMTRQVVRVIDDDQPFGGTWTWELVPEGDGTRLTVTEAGFIKSPIFRVLGKLFFSPTATMTTYLESLSKALDEVPVVERMGNRE